jgi:hypothetical protein
LAVELDQRVYGMTEVAAEVEAAPEIEPEAELQIEGPELLSDGEIHV